MYIDLLATKNVLGMVESTLRNLPKGLKELDTAYDDVITRIQNQDDDDVMMAKQILTWLYYAARPLSLQELRHSLAINLVAEADPDAIELDEAFLPDEEVIVSVCAGIVTCHAESNTVSFIHYTTKEYFKRRMDRQVAERFLHLEISIAETCLIYLSFERKDLENFLAARVIYHRSFTFREYAENECPDWNIDICYPLFRYAARYWGDHVNDMLGQVTRDLFMRFVRQRTALAASAQALAEEEYFDSLFPILISGLCLASFFGLNEIVMMLLENGQDMEAENEYDWTALHMAARRGHAVIVQLLVDKGANVNAVTEVFEHYTGTSEVTALHLAARNGYEKVLDILLNNGADIDLQTERGETALHWAAEKGHVGAIALLLNKGANLEAKSRDEYTPLCTAALGGQEACVKILIERGADLSVAPNGDSLLYLTAQGGNVELVQLLLEKGLDVNGGSVLCAAAGSPSQRRDDVVRLLLKEGADVSCRNENAETALHISAWREYDTTVRLLLESGAKVDAQNKAGETALHIATKCGSETVLQILVENGADATAKTAAGETALQCAAKWGLETIVQILIENGADATAKTAAGETALKLAAWNGHVATVRLLLDHLDGETNSEAWLATSQMSKVAKAGDEEAMQLLLEKGADITAEFGSYEETALHLAATEGHVALSRLLLENGANINAIGRNWFQKTPIAMAAQSGHIEVVRLLLEHKADLTQGKSPLLGAIYSIKGRSKLEIVQLLLENGADVSATNRNLETLLDAAMRQGSKYSKLIRKLLLEYGARGEPHVE